MESICSDRRPPWRRLGPPCERMWGAEIINQSWKQRHGGAGGRPCVCQTQWPQDRGKTQKGCCDKRRAPMSLQISAMCSRPSSWYVQSRKRKKKKRLWGWLWLKQIKGTFKSPLLPSVRRKQMGRNVFYVLKAVRVCDGREYSCFLLIHPNSVSQQPPQCSLSTSNLPVQSRFFPPSPAPQLLFLGASHPRLRQLCSVQSQTKVSVLGSSPSLQLPIQSIIKSWPSWPLTFTWDLTTAPTLCSFTTQGYASILSGRSSAHRLCCYPLEPHQSLILTLEAKSLFLKLSPVPSRLCSESSCSSHLFQKEIQNPHRGPKVLCDLTASRWPTSSLLSVCDSFQLRSNLDAVKCTDLIAQQSFPYVYVQATTIQIKVWHISINPESSLISLYS